MILAGSGGVPVRKGGSLSPVGCSRCRLPVLLKFGLQAAQCYRYGAE